MLQFGEPKRITQDPGLQFKIPFIQDAVYYERRVLSLIRKMLKKLFWRIKNAFRLMLMPVTGLWTRLLFFQTVRNEFGARARLESIIDSSVRRVLGRETLASILTGERETINGSIRDEVNSVRKITRD